MLQPIQPRPEESLWLYDRDGAEFGPTDLHGLQAMADCLHLKPGCQVWRKGQRERLHAAEVEGIRFPPPEPPPLPNDARYLRLYRSSDDRLLLGLCGGLAHRWGVPAALVRAAMLVLLVFMVGIAYPFAVLLPALPTRRQPDGRLPN
jgi:phage shock protein PspC (stress-responsive transcriptional regulator)